MIHAQDIAYCTIHKLAIYCDRRVEYGIDSEIIANEADLSYQV